MLASDCVLPARQRGRESIFFCHEPITAGSRLNRLAKSKALSENVYAAVLALPLVRQDFAAAITALSSLSVSPARKPRIRRND